jgi:hypothetical protein
VKRYQLIVAHCPVCFRDSQEGSRPSSPNSMRFLLFFLPFGLAAWGIRNTLFCPRDSKDGRDAARPTPTHVVNFSQGGRADR